MGALWKIRKILNNYRSQIILILTPLLLLPLILIEDEIKEVKLNPECDSLKPLCNTFQDSDEFDVIDGCVLNRNETYYKVNIQRPYKCLFSLICMATYWTFEVTPLAVTSLMPMFLFPLFGLLPAARVAAHYFKDINFLFFGGLVFAIAIEKCNLHLRIAQL
jgi:di/tricarboxylate transporter